MNAPKLRRIIVKKSYLASAFAVILFAGFAESAFAESCTYSFPKSGMAADTGYVVMNITPDDTGRENTWLKIPQKFLPLRQGQVSNWIQGSGNPLGENNAMDAKTYRTMNYWNGRLTITSTSPIEYRVYTLSTDAQLRNITSYSEVTYFYAMPRVILNCDSLRPWRY
jgi:hypothetical protein